MSFSELLSVWAHFIIETKRESNYVDLSSNYNVLMFFQFHNTDYNKIHLSFVFWTPSGAPDQFFFSFIHFFSENVGK